MQLAVTVVNVAATAQSYSVFAGLLAGFAFSGLCVYISRKPQEEKSQQAAASAACGRSDETHPRIAVKDIAAAVFFAMVSLGMSAFLYSNLAGIAQSGKRHQGPAITAILFYGIILALSVLSLLYALALMILEHPLTKEAARITYWVVTIAGSIMVLRFVAGSTRDAALSACRRHHICNLTGLLSAWGIGLTLLIAGLLSLAVTIALLEREPKGKVVGGLTRHPAWPPGMVFVVGFFVTTLGSLYISTRTRGFEPRSLSIYICYGISIFFIAAFALACGRVIAPRAKIGDDAVVGLLRQPEVKWPMWTAVVLFLMLLVFAWGTPALSVWIPAAIFVFLGLFSELARILGIYPEQPDDGRRVGEASSVVADDRHTAGQGS